MKKVLLIYSAILQEKAQDVRNIKFTELSREDYEKGFSMDFEKDNTIPSFWVRSWGQKKFAATIEKNKYHGKLRVRQLGVECPQK